MKAPIYILLIVSACSSALAQNYSGKFKHQPGLVDFEQFIVTQENNNGLQGAVVSVRAFDEQGNMWESKAHHAQPEVIAEVIKNFKNDKDVISVYELSFKRGKERVEYFMLGYRNEFHQEQFLLIEEWFHGPEHVVPIELNTFVWASRDPEK